MEQLSRSTKSYVAVVADNPQTLENLDAYFKRVGVESVGTRALQDASRLAPASTTLVLFPDDYVDAEVEAFVLSLRRDRPRLFILLVTSEPHRFARATEPDGQSALPLVIPRPAFGWTILDAIRSASARAKEEL